MECFKIFVWNNKNHSRYNRAYSKEISSFDFIKNFAVHYYIKISRVLIMAAAVCSGGIGRRFEGHKSDTNSRT